MELSFSGAIWYWRGPAPHHFLTVPEAAAQALADIAAGVTYGWGMVPVTVRLGGTTWPTSLWPKDGGYIVPPKAAVRARERVDVGDLLQVTLRVGSSRRDRPA